MEKKEIKRELLNNSAQLHLREREDGAESRTIAGYAVVFGVLSEPLAADETLEIREIIEPGAITQELLDGSDIKFTMFHDRQLILARSNKGQGTLKYSIDDKGVSFEFEAPDTVDGHKAVELVKRGDISGCSFAFSTRYYDTDFVVRDVANAGDKKIVTYRIKRVTGIYDMTLASDPAYSATDVQARELMEREQREPEDEVTRRERISQQIKEMRETVNKKY